MPEQKSLKLNDLKPPRGARKNRTRVGRGNGSGHGNYSGKGMKGQKARSGGGVRVGFQGGQLALIKSLPMIRGFTARSHKEFQLVNVDQLAGFEDGAEITARALVDAGLIDYADRPFKVLGRGEVESAMTVVADRFSESARAKIEAAGGTARQAEPQTGAQAGAKVRKGSD
jgi:large subunit ribosomal protein L15